MTDMLTVQEMRARFNGEWVLIENPETNQALEVQGGTVLHHSKDRDEVYRQAIALRPARFAVLFTGEMPPDTAVVL
jgi:hypothetical protein